LGSAKGNKISYNGGVEIEGVKFYNELEIPLRKMFDVELSDGTVVVHLNSGTKMRYPLNS